MSYSYKALLIFCSLIILLQPLCIHANEKVHQKLLKRKIFNKIVKANKLIKEKGLDRFVTLSVVVNDEIIYCHYEKEKKKKLNLIMCY